jgi:hypothetical protein
MEAEFEYGGGTFQNLDDYDWKVIRTEFHCLWELELDTAILTVFKHNNNSSYHYCFDDFDDDVQSSNWANFSGSLEDALRSCLNYYYSWAKE